MELLHGSIVAILYAMGFNSDEIFKIFKKYCKKIKYVEIRNIFKLIFGLLFTGSITIEGLNSGKQIEKLINKMANIKGFNNISDIKKNIVIPSVDICEGNLVCFSSCNFRKTFSDKIVFINDINIGTAVRASCSYPVVFSPCPYNKTKLIDGGIRENVPWKELKSIGADKVINIVFDDNIDNSCIKNLIDVANRSINLLCRELSNYELDGSDYTIKIKNNKIGLLDMSKINDLYLEGYIQTKKALVKFPEIVN